MRRGTELIALVLATSQMAASCGDEDRVTRPDVPGHAAVSQAAADQAVAAVCTLLATDDADAAARAFEDRAHDTIHAIAAGVRDAEPALAGAVLEAKEPIETAVAAGEPPASYHDDVGALLDAIGEALAELGLSAPSCGA